MENLEVLDWMQRLNNHEIKVGMYAILNWATTALEPSDYFS